MSIAELIKKHAGYLEQLTEAIGADDNHQIEVLDQMVIETFEAILATSTTSEHDAMLQADFLLDQLSPKSARSILARRICEKLLSLASVRNLSESI